jgi:SAM-dependent methyltransferase
MPDLRKIYASRFEQTGLEKRRRVWRVLCTNFFDDLVGPSKTVLDLACGYGEFINAVRAEKKIAVDVNPDAKSFLGSDVTHYTAPATNLSAIQASSVDVVFTSNFLEHLRDKTECDKVFAEVKRVLRPGGRFIIMGPNIRYAFREYWDYYDHYLPLSHLSLAEGLRQAGFEVVTNIPRFLPYTMNSSTPTADTLVKAYLSFPLAWRLFGKQFLVVAEKEAGSSA